MGNIGNTDGDLFIIMSCVIAKAQPFKTLQAVLLNLSSTTVSLERARNTAHCHRDQSTAVSHRRPGEPA